MRLAIDVREACHTPPTGKGRWTMGFVSALIKRDISMTLFTDRPLPPDLEKKWRAADLRIINKSGLFWHLKVATMVSRDPLIDVYVSTVSYIVPCVLRGRKPCVTVVHDLIAFRPDVHDRRATLIERLTLRPAIRHSRLVCAVSDTTLQDLSMIAPDSRGKAVTVYAGCDRLVAEKPTIGDGPIVCIGTLSPRKNQLGLIHAFALLTESLRAKHPLILIGARGWHDADIVRAAKAAKHVLWKGKITDAERDDILKDAALCAFPSFYEGFGLPVLEAFAAGIPVLTSSTGGLAEVAGDAALIVDPHDEKSIVSGLRSLLEDPKLRYVFAEKGLERARLFSWEKTADMFLKALERIDS